MDSVQVGKAVFVKVSFASLGFKPRAFFYPESWATNTLVVSLVTSSDSLLAGVVMIERGWE